MDYKKPQSTIVHGGAGIYPLTTADQVILADGSRLEKNGKINVDSAAESSKLGGKAPEYYLQPRNLLDNSDFRNPVNQRGAISKTNNGYFIDRWIIFSQDEAKRVTSIDSNGLTTAGGSAVRQLVQAELVPKDEGEYTFVVCRSDGHIEFPGKWKDSNGNLICPISNAGTYIWAALYEGNYTVDTLPPYVPKGYAAEFAECRRYYKRFTSPNSAIICAGYVTARTKCIYINALDNYPMRIVKPSCSFSGNITVRGINGYIAEDYSDVVTRVYANATGCISMIEIARGDSAAWNATNNTPLFVTINANSVFELIADL